MIEAYKLFRVRKDGTIGSLFINRKAIIPVGKWLDAETHPTDGFAVRNGWHAVATKKVPHLSLRGRRWYKVRLKFVSRLKRPKNQGSEWYIAGQLKVIGPA